MTTFELLFIAGLFAFGLITALILATRKSDWEAPEEKRMDTTAIVKAFDAYNQALEMQSQALQAAIEKERLGRERNEITQKLDIEALEASLEEEGLPDTSPPESAAVLQAIEYIESLE